MVQETEVQAARRRVIEHNQDEKNPDQFTIIAKNDPNNYHRDAHDQETWRQKKADTFHMAPHEEPHVIRRQQILKAHPEIMKLCRKDPRSALFAFGTVFTQIAMAWIVKDWPWMPLILITWIVSGTLNHSHVLAMHELSHDLWFPQRWQNRVMGYIVNLPCCVASAVTFQRYHLEHHTYQGSATMDADLPTAWEGRFFISTPRKLVWVFMQWAFYALRPLIVKPKKLITAEVMNWAVILAFDFLIIHFMGSKSFFYLLGGQLLGLGLHPMAGHFIAEHFEFIDGQETYSYYGPLNFFAYNVGYHNEHHDFPKVPGRLLPEVRKAAPEFYDTLPYYNSWTGVLTGFIFNKKIDCFCRVKRDEESEKNNMDAKKTK